MRATNPEKIEYLRAFQILFGDKNAAINLLIGSLLFLIPVVGPIVMMGWQSEIYRRLQRAENQYIPKLDLNDLVFYLKRGLVPFVVSMVLVLPFIFIMILGIFFVALIIGFLHKQGMAVPGAAFFLLMGSTMAIFLFLIPVVIFSNAALTRAYLTGDLGYSLDLKEIWNYGQRTWKQVFLAYVIFAPIALGLVVLGMLLFYVALYPALVIMNVAWVYLSWQIYRDYLGRAGEAIEISPPEPLPSEQRLVNPSS